MVGNVHGRHTYSKSAAERVREHREDPDRNTDGFFDEDDLQTRYLSPSKLGLWSPETYAQRSALVGWFDFSQQQYNELNETRSALLPRPSSRRVYHCMDWFTVGRWTSLSPDRFIRSNWEDLDNSYLIQPDFAASQQQDSVESGDGQAELGDYSNVAPCGYDGVRECDCCVCPSCGSVAIRERKNRIRAEKYACGNPACEGEAFRSPDVRPARRSD